MGYCSGSRTTSFFNLIQPVLNPNMSKFVTRFLNLLYPQRNSEDQDIALDSEDEELSDNLTSRKQSSEINSPKLFLNRFKVALPNVDNIHASIVSRSDKNWKHPLPLPRKRNRDSVYKVDGIPVYSLVDIRELAKKNGNWHVELFVPNENGCRVVKI